LPRGFPVTFAQLGNPIATNPNVEGKSTWPRTPFAFTELETITPNARESIAVAAIAGSERTGNSRDFHRP
jgi:hypothetical protein